MGVAEAREEFVAAARSGDAARFVRARALLEVAEARLVVHADPVGRADLARPVRSRGFGDWVPSHGVASSRWDPAVHPRDRLGRFAQVLSMLKKAAHGSVVKLPSGDYVTHKFGRYRLHDSQGSVLMRDRNPERVAREVVRRNAPKRSNGLTYEDWPSRVSVLPSLTERRAGGF